MDRAVVGPSFSSARLGAINNPEFQTLIAGAK